MRAAIVISMLLAGAIAAKAGGWWPFSGPATYDECTLAEMKGQPTMMYLTVDRVCKRRFKIQFEIALSAIWLEFSRHDNLFNFIVMKSGEYDVKNLEVRFSGKKCSESTNSDFEPNPREVEIYGNKGVVTGPGAWKFLTDMCTKTERVYAIYK